MWTASYLPGAEEERAALPAGERAAIQKAIEKLESLGIMLPFPHKGAVKGMTGGWWELRPRGGKCAWRPLYTRVGPEEFKIAAIAPDGKTDPAGFKISCDLAAERLARWKRERLDGSDNHG